MKIGTLDLAQRVFVIAEIGNNHEGDFAVAQELVARAAQAGVDAVKFQTFVPEQFVSRADPARLERLRRFQLSYDQFAQLARQARELGLVFFSTPLDLASARFLDTIQPLFKIASGDNNFLPLIDTVAAFAKPLIVSTGFADLALLARVEVRIRSVWAQRGVDPGLAFLHCVSCYPVPPQQANLAAIFELARRFPDCTIGYSDHTIGVQAAACAVAAGARIIEKHFTLDNNFSDFRDHRLSADPEDMRRLVDSVREVTALMGTGDKTPQACELESVSAVRRSIAAARDIPAGTVLTAADLVWLRPGSGIAPGREAELIGRKTARALAAGEFLQPTDVVA
jgi:N,N'-diacetyllegionaminate synthase